MGKYYFDMVCSLYHTDVVEAESIEEAKRIYQQLQVSDLYDQRLKHIFRCAPITSENLECIGLDETRGRNQDLPVTLKREDLERLGVNFAAVRPNPKHQPLFVTVLDYDGHEKHNLMDLAATLDRMFEDVSELPISFWKLMEGTCEGWDYIECAIDVDNPGWRGLNLRRGNCELRIDNPLDYSAYVGRRAARELETYNEVLEYLAEPYDGGLPRSGEGLECVSTFLQAVREELGIEEPNHEAEEER